MKLVCCLLIILIIPRAVFGNFEVLEPKKAGDLSVVFVDLPRSEGLSVILNAPEASSFSSPLPGLRMLWLVYLHERNVTLENARAEIGALKDKGLDYSALVKPSRSLYQLNGIMSTGQLEASLSFLGKLVHVQGIQREPLEEVLSSYKKRFIAPRIADDFFSAFGMATRYLNPSNHPFHGFSSTPGDLVSLRRESILKYEHDLLRVYDPANLQILIVGNLSEFSPDKVLEEIKRRFETNSRNNQVVSSETHVDFSSASNWIEIEGLEDRRHLRIIFEFPAPPNMKAVTALEIFRNVINEKGSPSLSSLFESLGFATHLYGDMHHFFGDTRNFIVDVELTERGFVSRKEAVDLLIASLHHFVSSETAKDSFENARGYLDLPRGVALERGVRGFEFTPGLLGDYLGEHLKFLERRGIPLSEIDPNLRFGNLTHGEYRDVIGSLLENSRVLVAVVSPEIKGDRMSPYFDRSYSISTRKFKRSISEFARPVTGGAMRCEAFTRLRGAGRRGLRKSYED